MKNQFKETLNIFKSTLEVEDFNFNTYWEWMFIPDNLKAAALYVQYYDKITLAGRKTKKFNLYHHLQCIPLNHLVDILEAYKAFL